MWADREIGVWNNFSQQSLNYRSFFFKNAVCVSKLNKYAKLDGIIEFANHITYIQICLPSSIPSFWFFCLNSISADCFAINLCALCVPETSHSWQKKLGKSNLVNFFYHHPHFGWVPFLWELMEKLLRAQYDTQN